MDAKADTNTTLQKAIDSLPETTSLVFVDYDDSFTDDQIADYLADDTISLYDSLYAFVGESEFYSFGHYLDASGLTSNEREELANNVELIEAFEMECRNRSGDDWFDDLVRNTGPVMVRYMLDFTIGPDAYLKSDAQIEKEMRGIAKAAGISFDTNRDALRSLVVEASYGGELCVIHEAAIQDVRGARRAVFSDPMLLVYDGWNGSGADAEVKGNVRVEITKDTARQDIGSMSWSDSIAMVVHSAYATPAEFVK